METQTILFDNGNYVSPRAITPNQTQTHTHTHTHTLTHTHWTDLILIHIQTTNFHPLINIHIPLPNLLQYAHTVNILGVYSINDGVLCVCVCVCVLSCSLSCSLPEV